MNPNEPTQLPPPSAVEVAVRTGRLGRTWPQRSKKKTAGIIAAAVGGVVLFGALAAAGGNDKDDSKKMTLVQAACQLLGDGETPEFTYSVMKDLVADHPLAYGEDESIAARAAVDRAQDQGC